MNKCMANGAHLSKITHKTAKLHELEATPLLFWGPRVLLAFLLTPPCALGQSITSPYAGGLCRAS